MKLDIIVARDERGGIGRDGSLPWHLPEDLQRFKTLTMGHTVIMGRKTYESIPKPLEGRTLIILSRDPDYQLKLRDNEYAARSFEDALDIAEQFGRGNAFIAGGADLYAHTMHLVDRVFLTEIADDFSCDRFFNMYPRSPILRWGRPADSTGWVESDNGLTYRFSSIKRIKSAEEKRRMFESSTTE